MTEWSDDTVHEPALDEQVLAISGLHGGAFFAQRYRITSVLGTGAMGRVFAAVDVQEQRGVALKILHPDMAKKPLVLERFRREAGILGELGHPGIVQVYEHGEFEGRPYLTMELLEGEDLKTYIDRRGRMTVDDALHVLVSVADALGAAHQQGVIHRDLKPENVFLLYAPPGVAPRVKVLDFGLSRGASDKRITATGVMIGTPRYMAPEQIRSAKDVDSTTDIYACGVIIHEALAGGSPFPAEDAGQLLGCVISGRVNKLEEVAPGVSPEVGAVVRRAMAVQPRDRYATLGAFAEAFAAAIGRATGRGGLLAAEGSGLFRDAHQGEPPTAEEALAAVGAAPVGAAAVNAQPTYGHARFTQPEPPPEPARPAVTASSRRRPVLVAAGVVLALMAVACLAAAVALGLHALARGGGSLWDPTFEQTVG